MTNTEKNSIPAGEVSVEHLHTKSWIKDEAMRVSRTFIRACFVFSSPRQAVDSIEEKKKGARRVQASFSFTFNTSQTHHVMYV